MSFKRLTEIKKLNDLLIYQGQNAPRFPGPFVLPVRTQRITSFFAQSRTLRYSTGQSEEAVHYGIDFGIPTGSQVSAAGDGLVVMTENRISTGWTIVIEHDPGIYSLYYHLDTLLVRNGALVHSGDPYCTIRCDRSCHRPSPSLGVPGKRRGSLSRLVYRKETVLTLLNSNISLL